MSRKSKKGIKLAEGVVVNTDQSVYVVTKGDKSIELDASMYINVVIKDSLLKVERVNDSQISKQQEGLYHALLSNAIEGVTKGFSTKLLLKGVGYRSIQKGSSIELQVGYSHPINIEPLEGITLQVSDPTTILVSGIKKEVVGQMTANIMSYRPAKKDPYKQKGIFIEGTRLRKKEGKKAK